MRITGIRVRSFGALNDVGMDPAPGLNVFHGPNESGKTTVMEFVRRCMSPTRQTRLYPAWDRTDSGRLVLEEDGSVYELELKGRNAVGTYPPSLEGMSPAVFRGLFAMNPGDLVDATPLKDDGVRASMVGVPGGDSVPEAIRLCEDRVDSILGRTDRSRSELNAVDSRIDGLDSRIAALRSEAGRYGELAGRRNAILEEMGSIASGAAERDRRLYDAYASNRGNYDRLAEISEALDALGPGVSDGDVDTYRSLSSAVERAGAVMASTADSLEDARARLGGVPPDVILSRRDDVDALVRGQTAYERDLRSGSRRGFPVAAAVALAGAVLAAAGAATGSVGLTAVGAVAAVAGLVLHVRRRRSAVPVAGATDYESLYGRTASAFGIVNEGMDAGISRMRALCRNAEDFASAEEAHGRSSSAYTEAELSLTRFLAGYGGERGWEEAVSDSGTRRALESERAVVRRAVSDAGLDPDEPVCPVTAPDGPDRSSELARELGSVEERMHSILDDGELNSLMDARAFEETRRDDVLRRGAVALIAAELGRMACDDASSEVRPGVLMRADGYLRRMTGGRYRIHPDSVQGEVSVESPDGARGLSMCSSGLRSQVMLSIKLAMAVESGRSGVPLILDDVLLDYDSVRKGAACDLLHEVSSEVQVLYFTCDRETYNLFMRYDDCNEFKMGIGLN